MEESPSFLCVDWKASLIPVRPVEAGVFRNIFKPPKNEKKKSAINQRVTCAGSKHLCSF